MLVEASFNAEMLRSAGVARDPLEQPQVASSVASSRWAPPKLSYIVDETRLKPLEILF